MHDAPSSAQIIGAVTTWLRELATREPPEATPFESRVAAAALDIVRRQTEEPAEVQAAELARLSALLGAEGSLEEMTQRLADRIAAGELDLSTPGLADHLWRTTLDKVAVDQPGFGLYRRLTGGRGA